MSAGSTYDGCTISLQSFIDIAFVYPEILRGAVKPQVSLSSKFILGKIVNIFEMLFYKKYAQKKRAKYGYQMIK